MSLEQEILHQIDTTQLAEQLGTDPQTAEQSAAEAIRALVGGMQQNAQSPNGEASLANALSDHASSSLFDGTLDLNRVDQNDGAAIAGHVLGNPAEVSQFGGFQAAGGDQQLVNKVIKLLAPIVMAYIAKRITEGQGDVLGRAKEGQGGGILSDILGKVLGGGVAQQQPEPQAQQPQQPQQGDGGFTQQQTSNDGELRMDVPTDEGSARGQQPNQGQQKQDGGILGQILGGIFGR